VSEEVCTILRLTAVGVSFFGHLERRATSSVEHETLNYER
jgi:hypothetical protein